MSPSGSCFLASFSPSLPLSLFSLQNAPVNFQVVLVAIESNSEDTDFNMEMVRQFAREKQLQLVTCNVRDSAKVQEAFQILIEKIMATLTTDGVGTTSIDTLKLGHLFVLKAQNQDTSLTRTLPSITTIHNLLQLQVYSLSLSL